MSGLLPRTTGNETTGSFTNLSVQNLIVTAAGYINDLSVGALHLSSLVLTSLTTPLINGNPGLNIAVSAPGATVNSDTIATLTATQTLTGKTLDSAVNTITITNSPLSGTNVNSILNQDVRTTAGPTFSAVTLTTAAFHPITVNNTSGTSGNDIIFQNSGTNIVAFGANQTTNEAYAFVFANQPLKFGTNSTERMRIAAAGIANDNTITNILGLQGTTLSYKNNIVDTSSTQTLTNKTLDSGSNTITITNSPLSAANVNSLINQDIRTTASPVFVAVGTGSGAPTVSSELQFSTSVTNTRKLVLLDGASPANTNQFVGVGVESSTMVFSSISNTHDYIFYVGTGTGTRNEVFRVKGNSTGLVIPVTGNASFALNGKGDYGYSSGGGTFFSNAVVGDINLRNVDTTKNLNLGLGGAVAQMSIANTLTTFTTDINIDNATTNSKKLALTVNNGATASTTSTISAAQTANRTITLPDATTTLVGTDATQTITNKTITSSTNTVYSSALLTTGAAVITNLSSAPTTVGQVLATTSVTNATWQTPLDFMFFGNSSTDQTYSVNTTLSGDVYFRNVTLNGGVTVTTAGYRMFINGTLTLNTSSSIQYNGNTGVAGGSGGAGGAALSSGSIGGATVGGAGGIAITVGSAGGNAPTNTNIASVAGGAGGSGNAGGAAGGAAGSSTTVSLANGGVDPLLDVNRAMICRDLGNNLITGGTGGGGGGGGVAVAGGGGGSGGGVVMVVAFIVIGAGTISANGGNGGAGVSSISNSSGGGGGGGGGVVVLVHGYFGGGFTTAQVTATGGTGGAAGGTGGNAGSNGSAGVVIIY